MLLLIDLAGRIGAAILLGAVIGLERQWRLRTAGIRTNALVAGGSALFVALGAVGWQDEALADPTRVAAQVVSGIGFLGAGVILRDGLKIRGLTTAATLWCAGAVGSLAGSGLLPVAVVGAAAIVATNVLLRPVGRFVNRRSSPGSVPEEGFGRLATDYTFEVVAAEKSEPRVKALVLQVVDRPEFTLRSLKVRRGTASQVRVVAGISATADATDGFQVAVRRLSLDPKVLSTRWWLEGDD